METLFKWNVLSENNKLGFFSRFSNLDLFIFINELEIMMGLFIEKSVDIKYNVVFKKIILTIITRIIIKWRYIINRVFRYWNTS